MRLFTRCKTDGRLFYIKSPVRVRSELPSQFYLTCPYNHRNFYFPSEIFAESSESNIAVGGALAGGAIGLLGGGIGAIIGAIAGAILGTGKERLDNEAVNRFNNSN